MSVGFIGRGLADDARQRRDNTRASDLDGLASAGIGCGDRTVEEARIEAGNGADLIRVQAFDDLGGDANVNSLRMSVYGGEDAVTGKSFEHRRTWIKDRLFIGGEEFEL